MLAFLVLFLQGIRILMLLFPGFYDQAPKIRDTIGVSLIQAGFVGILMRCTNHEPLFYG